MCFVNEGTQPFSFSWSKDGKEIPPTSNIRAKADVDYSVAVINPVDENSAGNYTCIVKNIFGFDSYSAYLDVEAPPLLKRTSSDMDVVQGNAVNLVCHATGSPQPIVSWTRSKGNTNKRNPISLPTSNASQMLLFQGRLAFFNLQSQAPGCSPSRTELCASRMLHQRTRGNIPARRITALGTQAIRCSCTSAVRVVADITLLNNT